MSKKTIILVRHGQYHSASDKELERLSNLGRQQAKYAARRLKEIEIDRICSSTMPRAIETAALIKRVLNYKGKTSSCEKLNECVPGFPKLLRKKYGHTDTKKLKLHQAQAEAAYKKHFKAPKKDSTEILVCHGNMIRYLICRLLEIDSDKWIQMDILQCSISTIQIRSKGHNRRVLLSFNEIGHIPKSKRTFL